MYLQRAKRKSQWNFSLASDLKYLVKLIICKQLEYFNETPFFIFS